MVFPLYGCVVKTENQVIVAEEDRKYSAYQKDPVSTYCFEQTQYRDELALLMIFPISHKNFILTIAKLLREIFKKG